MDKELELEADLYLKQNNINTYLAMKFTREGFIAGATTSSRVKKLENRVKELEEIGNNLVRALRDPLPIGNHKPKEIEKWLVVDVKPALEKMEKILTNHLCKCKTEEERWSCSNKCGNKPKFVQS